MSDEAKLKKLWEGNKLKEAKLPDLKQYLKSVGLPMVGEISTVAKRVGMQMDVKYLDLFVMQDGEKATPFKLKPVQLRKIVAQLGMDPTGDKDELHFSLIEHLKAKGKKSDSGKGDPSSGEPQGIVVAKQILEMQTDYPAVLSASGINITTDSSVATMRKAYLKLSLLIHPDKLQSIFPDATKAFQCLVNAYERLSQPELFLDEEDEKKKKDKKVMRSNDGCHRTEIYCPRCEEEWGLPVTGVESYDYNFMMMGLKTYNCSTCLLDFGCMTAIHKCPFCKNNFEFHPDDYHRKIKCPNAKCDKPFGFFIFHISDKREREFRLEIRKKREQILMEKQQHEDRLKRAKSRQSNIGPKGTEKLFVMNLLDKCPRCGEEVEADGEEVRIDHLKNCNDKAKIGAYAKQLKAEEEIIENKRKRRDLEEEVQGAQMWDYFGGKTTELWLLSETKLRKMCEMYQLDSSGSKEELIARVASHRNELDSKRMLTQGDDVQLHVRKRLKVSAEDLPSNMQSMSVSQLKSVCAANGIDATGKTKSAIIKDLEKLAYGDVPFLKLTDGKKK